MITTFVLKEVKVSDGTLAKSEIKFIKTKCFIHFTKKERAYRLCILCTNGIEDAEREFHKLFLLVKEFHIKKDTCN